MLWVEIQANSSQPILTRAAQKPNLAVNLFQHMSHKIESYRYMTKTAVYFQLYALACVQVYFEFLYALTNSRRKIWQIL